MHYWWWVGTMRRKRQISMQKRRDGFSLLTYKKRVKTNTWQREGLWQRCELKGPLIGSRGCYRAGSHPGQSLHPGNIAGADCHWQWLHPLSRFASVSLFMLADNRPDWQLGQMTYAFYPRSSAHWLTAQAHDIEFHKRKKIIIITFLLSRWPHNIILLLSRSKLKKVQTNAYLFWHGHTACKCSGNPLCQATKRHLSSLF